MFGLWQNVKHCWTQSTLSTVGVQQSLFQVRTVGLLVQLNRQHLVQVFKFYMNIRLNCKLLYICRAWAGTHKWVLGPDLNATYWLTLRLCGKKGKAETVSPQPLEGIQGIPSNAEKFLLLHQRTASWRETWTWYRNSTEQDHKALERVINSDECTKICALLRLKDIYTRIFKDPIHQDKGLFSLLR